MTTETIVEVHDFSYSYGAGKEFAAVKGLNLTVKRGELYALLGTNGAGKTTTLETIEGHRRPTAGKVSVFGGDPTDRRTVRPRVGIMLQEGGLATDMTVTESVELAGKISGRADVAAQVVERVELAHKADTRVSQLSGGEKRRLDFGMAIWGTPELLFLDEPTTGLDPAARDRIWETVGELRQAGTTIILTTHYLEEAQNNADRIGLMHHGVLEREGTITELVAGEASHIRFVAPSGVELPLPVSATENGVTVIDTDDLQRDLTTVLDWANRGGYQLDQLSASTSTLDEVFRSLVRS